jgi:2-amino-4-hydroxy-6-hydroxymethyldihydropteridine diphosphokinase/CDP-diacylglycerol--serine O-phosphatidyltransferase
MAPRIKPVAILPTLCTLGNTFCGFLAISKIADALLHQNAEAFRQNIVFAAWMIVLAMVFDALDGKIARLTNQTTDFGAQLDSLTDLITFGVAPAFLVKVVADYTFTTQGVVYQDKLPLLLTSVYAICAALRLARFTLETEPDPKAHETFKGLPSPGAAGVIAGTALVLFEKDSPLASLDAATRLTLVKVFLGMPIALGLLMVSRVEYVHLVSRWFKGRKPFVHLLMIVGLVFVAATWHEVAFFVAFTGYAIAGPGLAIAERMLGRKLLVPDDDEEEDGDGKRAQTALIALGSNLGDREAHLRFAIEQLRLLPDTRVTAVSSFHETQPVGGPPQRPFLNAAVRVSTGLSPEGLRARMADLEKARGRERTVRDGPRTLDLDLVLFGATICETPTLTLPHPRFRDRAFVLAPAAEIAGDLVDPVSGKSITQLFAALRAPKAP